jgi:hypothetical protein
VAKDINVEGLHAHCCMYATTDIAMPYRDYLCVLAMLRVGCSTFENTVTQSWMDPASNTLYTLTQL